MRPHAIRKIETNKDKTWMWVKRGVVGEKDKYSNLSLESCDR